MGGSAVVIDIEFLLFLTEAEWEQFERISPPEQLMHPKLKGPSCSGSRHWIILESIVTAFHIRNPVLQVSFPQKFEYTPRGNRFLVNRPRSRRRLHASDEVVGLFEIWGLEREWQGARFDLLHLLGDKGFIFAWSMSEVNQLPGGCSVGVV